jgi:methionine--tRNA ligase beta chain
MISFADFEKLDLRVGTIQKAKPITDADRLLLLSVSLEDETRQIIAGIKPAVDDVADLAGRQVVVVVNLELKEMFGYESQGMILATRGDTTELIGPKQPVADGAVVS